MGCLGGIVVPLLFEEELGKFSAVFLALGFLCLLCAFAVVPALIDNKWKESENKYFPNEVLAQREWSGAVVRYVKGIRAAFGIGVFLLAVGVVGFVILH